jgi:hypothetical protein
VNSYIDMLTRNATAIARITCFGLLLLVAMSGMSSARATDTIRPVCAPQAEAYRFELSKEETVNYCLGRKPTRARRRWALTR